MADLKTYSIIINWDDTDDEQGNFAATVRAPNEAEAEAITRSLMRATDEGSWPFGSVVECSEGAAWAAADLEKALRPIVWQLERMDGLPKEVEAMIADAKNALKRCEPEEPAWGTLHYDGSPTPDWSKFRSLEIDGCVEKTDDDETDDRHIHGGRDDHEAEFWTIYGRDHDGLAQALQDCVSRAEADHVLKQMMELSGLPGYRVGESMPEAIKGLTEPTTEPASQSFVVQWEIEINAASPREAAEIARQWQRDKTAQVGTFDVIDEAANMHRIDLEEPAHA